MIRIAVASKEGLAISEHFGHAKLFHIYDVAKDNCNFVERRDVDHYCLGGHSDKNALIGILETIKDCQAVFVAKIGDGPTEKLKNKGIKAIAEYAWEDIKTSLLDYTNKHLS